MNVREKVPPALPPSSASLWLVSPQVSSPRPALPHKEQSRVGADEFMADFPLQGRGGAGLFKRGSGSSVRILNHYAVPLKLIQYCKSTTLRFKKKREKRGQWSEVAKHSFS